MSMEEIIPRFEFRAFDQHLDEVAEKIRRLATEEEEVQESLDTYVVSKPNETYNVKVRDSLLDIKVLLQRRNGLEQWRPEVKEAFPVTAELLREQVFPALKVKTPPMERPRYTLPQCFQELIWPHEQLSVAHVFKRRARTTIGGCMAEIDHLEINGAALGSVALEGADAAEVAAVRSQVGLDVYENVNYVLALRRLLGLVPTPAYIWSQ